MRGREFIMKDAYSFHSSEKDLQATYVDMDQAYRRIFERCGLEAVPVDADSGAIGGAASQEFMVTTAFIPPTRRRRFRSPSPRCRSRARSSHWWKPRAKPASRPYARHRAGIPHSWSKCCCWWQGWKMESSNRFC